VAERFPKLRAALRKAINRATQRGEYQEEAEHSAHRLSREIDQIREGIEQISKEHAETLAEIAKEEEQTAPDAARLKRLKGKAAIQAENLRHLVARVEHKRSRRTTFRTVVRRQRMRARWWIARRTVLSKKLAEAEEKWEKEHRLDFEAWMLNGCPDVNNANLKEVIAFVVVRCGQYVTATTNGTHAPGSFHDIEEAVDWGAGSVSSMQDAANATRAHFGDGHFLEFFSPCPWWIKYGVDYAGFFPGHGDHGHCAVDR
jgi:hypothetical protein